MNYSFNELVAFRFGSHLFLLWFSKTASSLSFDVFCSKSTWTSTKITMLQHQQRKFFGPRVRGQRIFFASCGVWYIPAFIELIVYFLEGLQKGLGNKGTWPFTLKEPRISLNYFKGKNIDFRSLSKFRRNLIVIDRLPLFMRGIGHFRSFLISFP